MSRYIPGFGEKADGREFFYIQIVGDADFRRLVDDALASSPQVRLPAAGGIIEEKVRIGLPSDALFLGVSYIGDLEGWRNKLVSFCETHGMKWAMPRGIALAISDGSEVPLQNCVVTFER